MRKRATLSLPFFNLPSLVPTQTSRGGANLKVRCVSCPNFHMSKQGSPSQYLGLCDFFKNQSLSKQKELLKTHKMCHICLSPKSSCRKESDPSVCQRQVHYNFKCRQCGDLQHHTVMCPQSQTQNRQDAQSFHTQSFHPQQSSHPPPPTSTSSGPSPSTSNTSCAFSDISNSYYQSVYQPSNDFQSNDYQSEFQSNNTQRG